MCVLDGNNLVAGRLLLEALVGSVRSPARVGGVIRANGAKLKRGLVYINSAFIPAGDINVSPITVSQGSLLARSL